MSGYKLSQRSLQRLEGVHPDLVRIVQLAIQRSLVDFTVVEGVRTMDRQRELVAKGASQTLDSYHLKQRDGFAHAVDVAPLVSGSIPWNSWAEFAALADVMKSCATEIGVPLEWGGDWKTFKDGPHFQIPRDWSGSRAAT